MEAALVKLGYSVCGVRHDLIEAVRTKDLQTIRNVVDQFDAVQDNPWPVLYRELDQLFPGSKFILTIREEQVWYESVLNHFNSTPSPMQELIYGFSYPADHKAAYLKTYLQHISDVNLYFENRSSDFLIIDITQDPTWNRLCSFLDKPIPHTPFPHFNKGAYTLYGKIWKYLWKRIRARWRRLFS